MRYRGHIVRWLDHVNLTGGLIVLAAGQVNETAGLVDLIKGGVDVIISRDGVIRWSDEVRFSPVDGIQRRVDA